MHIEPGYIAPAKVALANLAAVGVLAAHAGGVWRQPGLWGRTLLAALFFSLFMQGFHLPVGPSELHFVGAMAIYLVLGFRPTLFGFACGLLLQGVWFDPADLVHLAVNSLSLILPLMLVHHTLGRRLAQGEILPLGVILRLDALYYGGVTAMVGFWLMVGEVSTPFASWLAFAASYAAVVVVEPLFTWVTLRLLLGGKTGSRVRSALTLPC